MRPPGRAGWPRCGTGPRRREVAKRLQRGDRETAPLQRGTPGAVFSPRSSVARPPPRLRTETPAAPLLPLGGCRCLEAPKCFLPRDTSGWKAPGCPRPCSRAQAAVAPSLSPALLLLKAPGQAPGRVIFSLSAIYTNTGTSKTATLQIWHLKFQPNGGMLTKTKKKCVKNYPVGISSHS